MKMHPSGVVKDKIEAENENPFKHSVINDGPPFDKIQWNLDLVTIYLVTNRDLVTLFPTTNFLLSKIHRFSDILVIC